MREWQQGLGKVMVLREAERSLSLTQPGVHSTQGHTGSFCSQDLTLPRPELTTETCGHPSTLSTDYRARQDRQAECAAPATATSSRFLGLVRNLSSTTTLSWAEQPRMLETLKGNCFAFQCSRSSSTTEPTPSPAPEQAHTTPNPCAGRAGLSTEGI